MSEKKDKDELGSYTSEILRGPERSVKAMLLAEHLILSVTSPPLKSIMHIVQAAAMLSDDERNRLDINYEEVKILLTLSNLLSDPPLFSEPGYLPRFNISIRSLVLDWDLYFKPWMKQRVYSYWTEVSVKSVELNKRLLRGDRKVHAVYSFAHLTESGYNAAVTDFVTWAIPEAQRLSEKISTLVDQRTFTDIMKIVQRPIETQR